MPPFTRFVAALAALGLAGCSEALGPGDYAGTYVLYRYDGGSLPRPYTTDRGCTVMIQSGTLQLQADATFSLEIGRTERCPGVNAIAFMSYSLGGTFTAGWSEVRLRTSSGSVVVASLRGTHLIVPVPQPGGLSPATVNAEFMGGDGGRNVTVEVPSGENPSNPPLPPPGGVVIIIKRR